MAHTATLTNAQPGMASDRASTPWFVSPAVELRTADGEQEWLLTNARGAFALGAVDRVLRRKYHTVLSVGAGSTGARNLVAEVLEHAVVGDVEYALLPLGVAPETGVKRPRSVEFACRESAVWLYDLGPVRLRRELALAPGGDGVALRYEVQGDEPVTLRLEPLLLFRSVHAVARKDLFLDGRVQGEGAAVSVAPYAHGPRLHMSVSGFGAGFELHGAFRELVHDWEGERGYERGEFAFSPGSFRVRLAPGAPVVLTLGTEAAQPSIVTGTTQGPASGVRNGALSAILEQGLRAHLLKSARGAFVVGGYPWFGESLRSTLLALPGLSVVEPATFVEVLEAAGRLLAERSTGTRRQAGDDDLDAPLLFIRAVQLAARNGHTGRAARLAQLAEPILHGWINGSHPRIRLSAEGLLYTTPGPWALTWMNATVDGLPVTARSGYAVDVNALFVNALAFLSRAGGGTESGAPAGPWAEMHARANAAFRRHFCSAEHAHLADCHDGQTADFSIRPNQLWAAALPFSPLSHSERLAVVDTVRAHLLTDVGIRTLSPTDPRYAGRCEGDARSRDSAAHQGSAWPFLLGLYADALGELGAAERLREDLVPVLARLERHVRSEACLGHVSELFDGDAPHGPRGAPAHAASEAELLRVARMVER